MKTGSKIDYQGIISKVHQSTEFLGEPQEKITLIGTRCRLACEYSEDKKSQCRLYSTSSGRGSLAGFRDMENKLYFS